MNKRLFVPVPQQTGSREEKEQRSLRMLLSKGSQLRGRILSCPSSDQQVALFLDCLPVLLLHSEGWVAPRNVPVPTQITVVGILGMLQFPGMISSVLTPEHLVPTGSVCCPLPEGSDESVFSLVLEPLGASCRLMGTLPPSHTWI